MIGRVETGTINRERRKTMTVVLEIEVTTSISHINLQQTNPLKMTKKNDLHQLKLRKWKEEKRDHFLVKWDHINKDGKKDLKRWKLKTMTKARPIIVTNKVNTRIVPDTQDVPNQIEENGSNFVRDNFFLYGRGATKANQRKN